MLKMRRLGHVLIVGFIAWAGYQYFASGSHDGADYPRKPIRVVVPFQPGGGSDTFVRILQKAIKDNALMPKPLVVVNKPGGGTSIGSSYVRNAPPDGYTVLCLHDALMVAKSSGQSLDSPADFEAVAATGEFGEVIVVSEDSPYRDLPALMASAQENPETVKFGVSLNTPPHFSAILLENAVPGTRFRFVATGGGANRLTGLVGGHLDVIILSVGEYIRFEPNGLRAIAYLGDERLSAIPEIPTAKEAGFPVSSSNLHQWWFPRGTKPEIVAYFADVLAATMKTDYVQRRTAELQILPKYLAGEALQNRIREKLDAFGAIKAVSRVDLPNFTHWTLGFVAVLALIVFAQWRANSLSSTEEDDGSQPRFDLAFGTLALVVIYVLLMGLGVLSFVWATMIFIAVAGLFLTGGAKSKLIYVAESALVMSFGLHFVFVQLFTIDLP
jgi:putative tricarboxylic transport membrane protein